MKFRSFCSLVLWCVLSAPSVLPAQQAEGASPAAVYPRPDLSPGALDLRDLQLEESRRDSLMEMLARLARNFPNDPSLTMEWRARILALALHIRPEDYACLVANGQLARGVQPAPVADPAALDLQGLTAELLKFTSNLLREETDPKSSASQLGLHLLDIAAHLNPANRGVLEMFKQEAPPLTWKKLVPGANAPNRSTDEESPDLLLTNASVTVLVPGEKPETWRTVLISAQAERMPISSPRKPLELHLPVEVQGDFEKRLADLRKLLKARVPRWPSGWSIQIQASPAIPMDDPAALLGIGLTLNSLVTGIDTDPTVRLLCGLDPATGRISRTVDWTALPGIAPQSNADTLLVIPEIFTDEINDLRISNPERYAALRKLNLFMVSNFQEAASLASATRPPALDRGLRQFLAVQSEFSPGVLSAVRTPAMKERLTAIMNFCPRYLSPRLFLEDTFKSPPTILSRNGSIALLNQLGLPVLKAGSKRFPIRSRWPDKLDATPWAKARGHIERIRPRLAPETRGFADALCDLAKIYDQMVLYPPFTPIDKAECNRRINTATLVLKAATKKLGLEEAQAPPPEDTADPPP